MNIVGGSRAADTCWERTMGKLRPEQRYPSDLTDDEWAILQPLLPARRHMGRPPKHDRRQIVNALLYLLRTGCQWRMLPKDYPPFTTVRYYFDLWTDDGTFQRINDALREKVRLRDGRMAQPSAAVVDSQSVKTTEVGGTRGYDGGKKAQRA
jgi:putative transposase